MKHIELKETIKKRITSILSENQMTTDEAFRALRDIHSKSNPADPYTRIMGQALDVLQSGEISKMMDRERGLNEGTWSLGTVMQVQNFLRDMEKIKTHYYDIVGDDQVFNGLDNAIERAKELEMEAPENRSDITEDFNDDNRGLAYIKSDGETDGAMSIKKELKRMRFKNVPDMEAYSEGFVKGASDLVDYLKGKLGQSIRGGGDEESLMGLVGLDEDEEPTSADLKKKDSVTTTSNKLQKLVKQMKEKAKEFKAAEGDKKDKLKDELKKMTKEKKELEKSIG